MAQVVYHSDNYPVGTELTDLDFTKVSGTSSYVQEISSGRNFYEGSGSSFSPGAYRKTYDGETQIEILFLANFTPGELGRSYGYKYSAGVGDNVTFTYNRNGSDSELQNEFVGVTYDSYTYTPPATAIPSITKAFGMRLQYNSTTRALKARTWGAAVDGLEAAEPAIWHHDGIADAGSAGTAWAQVQLLAQVDGFTLLGASGDFTTLSIGTAGDAAAYPSVSQTVTTPSTPVLSNITDTTADVDWT